MIVVLPFYSADAYMLEKNLLWMKELDDKLDFDCVLASDDLTDDTKIAMQAGKVFKSVRRIKYNRLTQTKWPYPQNHAFSNVCWQIGKLKQPWLWVETDATPMRPKWLQDIAEEHKKGGKPFTGHWSETNHVFNGVGVYPPDVVNYSRLALRATLVVDPKGNQPPWDVYASKEIEKHMHKANHLFQHAWDDPATGKAHTFPDMDTVKKVVRKGVALFHRCKDLSLVRRLHEQSQKSMSKDLRWTL